MTTVPTDNRWYPLMQRYVHHMGLRVDALGGDASAVHPNPDGSGRPYDPSGVQPAPDACAKWRLLVYVLLGLTLFLLLVILVLVLL
jgi:hypothetical protein